MRAPPKRARLRTAEDLEFHIVSAGGEAGALFVFHWGGKTFRIVVPGHLAERAAMQMQEVARKRVQ